MFWHGSHESLINAPIVSMTIITIARWLKRTNTSDMIQADPFYGAIQGYSKPTALVVQTKVSRG